MRFSPLTPQRAAAPADAILASVERSLGFVPNLMAVMAVCPPVLAGYVDLQHRFGEASLDRVEQQVVLLAVSVANRCSYCVPVHTVTARDAGVPEDIIVALRRGKPLADPKLEALRAFAAQVARTRGEVTQQMRDRFQLAGYGETDALAVVLGIALKTLSNYVNHLTQPQLDAPLADARWEHPEDPR